jgi:hypothetical protein
LLTGKIHSQPFRCKCHCALLSLGMALCFVAHNDTELWDEMLLDGSNDSNLFVKVYLTQGGRQGYLYFGKPTTPYCWETASSLFLLLRFLSGQNPPI